MAWAVGSEVPLVCVNWPLKASFCITSWSKLLIIDTVVPGGNPVATAREDLSVSSSFSFGVGCFACSSCSSLCSVVVSRLWFCSSIKVLAPCSCGTMMRASIVFCAFFLLRVERGLHVVSARFLLARRARGLQIGSHFRSVPPWLLDLGLRFLLVGRGALLP